MLLCKDLITPVFLLLGKDHLPASPVPITGPDHRKIHKIWTTGHMEPHVSSSKPLRTRRYDYRVGLLNLLAYGEKKWDLGTIAWTLPDCLFDLRL